ncbi:hypothetical protein SDC9_165498 [bioreactor metagenome]|uniref:Uncharacterized protein n=1 Tax=bioreactor metagenome TaxID=1076179 RepID=A0A645FWV2_9ZZZZ
MMASCSSGVVRTTSRKPIWKAMRSSRARCSGRFPSRGVRMKCAPWNSRASAWARPLFSLPAMGWLPTKSTVSGRHCAASATAVFTPHTSVISAPGLKSARCSRRKSTMPRGCRQSTTTSAVLSADRSSVTRSPAPRLRARARVSGFLSSPMISKSSKPRRERA